MITETSSCVNCKSLCSGIFNSLKEEELAINDLNKITHFYKKGDLIVREGEILKGIHCIKSGIVKLTKENQKGNTTIIKLLKKGATIGHQSLYTKLPHQHSAIAVEDVKVCFFSGKFITSLLESNSVVSTNLLQAMGIEIEINNQKINSLASKTIAQKLAELLIILSSEYGQEIDNEIQLQLKLTREEMASLIGTSTESLIRTLSDLRGMGLIRQEKKTLYISKIKELQELALVI